MGHKTIAWSVTLVRVVRMDSSSLSMLIGHNWAEWPSWVQNINTKVGRFLKENKCSVFYIKKKKKKNVEQEKNNDSPLYLLSWSSSFLVEGKQNKKMKRQVISVAFCFVAPLSTSGKREFLSNMINVQIIFGIE